MAKQSIAIVCICWLFLLEALQECNSNSIKESGKNVLGDDNRIIGGKEAEPFTYPFMVRLSVKTTHLSFTCGGILINEQWVLTAGHCVYDQKTRDFWTSINATFGEHNVLETEYTETYRKAANVIIHENYLRGINKENDIALIKLVSPVCSTDEIKPACLASAGREYVGQIAKSIGWGSINMAGVRSPVLKEVQIPIVSDSQCSLITAFNGKNMICSGFIKEIGTDTVFRGDSGGPLFNEHESGQFTVVGVNSFVQAALIDGTVKVAKAIFVKVSVHIDWINSKIYPFEICTSV